MALYDADIRSAKQMIAKYGQRVQWMEKETTLNAAEPWKDAVVNFVQHPVSIAFFPPDTQTLRSLSHRAGTEIPKASVLGYMGAYGFEPKLGDEVSRGGIRLAVVYVDTVAPNGRSILHTVLFA